MLMFGRNLLSASTLMQSITVEEIAQQIKHPEVEFLSAIARLRAIRNVDRQKYAEMKRKLPYFTCAIFNPSYRRLENLAFLTHFIIDIDHLSEKGFTRAELKEKFSHDPRIKMCFVSPSEDGLKIMFHLSERCYDAGQFNLFYKSFLRHFSDEYHLEQVVDKHTCDASRACFMSYDPTIYFNPHAQSINMKDFTDFEDLDNVFEQDYANSKALTTSHSTPTDKLPTDPDTETLNNIKLILQQHKALVQQSHSFVFVPEVLNDVIDEVKTMIEETGIVIDEVKNIQYGKKIMVHLGIKRGEVNIFYGKRGFSVVQSTKRGCSAELNEALALLLKNFFEIS